MKPPCFADLLRAGGGGSLEAAIAGPPMNGAVELDIYPGEDCCGEYFDDGTSVNGPSLRQSLQCEVTPNAVELSFARREGSCRPWWKQIAVTLQGAQPVRMTIVDQPRAGKIIIHQ